MVTAMKNLKLAIIGGGSSYTPELIDGIIRRIRALPVTEICLVAIEDGERKVGIIANFSRHTVYHVPVSRRWTGSPCS